LNAKDLNVVQLHKRAAFPAMIDHALECAIENTSGLKPWLGALLTLKKTSGAQELVDFYIKPAYKFDVWNTFFANGGIVDKLAQSFCSDIYGDENQCQK
jgi:hypothetical protein